MKVVILAGGLGTRISEESHIRPKPMIEIGDKPILLHLMEIFSEQGFKDFVICAGYKQHIIKEFFSNLDVFTNDVIFDYKTGKHQIIGAPKNDWSVAVLDTGINTGTGGRLGKVRDFIGNERFILTYGDGLGNVDLRQVISSHERAGKMATVTVHRFAQNKGVVKIDESGLITSFQEKSEDDVSLINIGFMVCEPAVFDLVCDDSCVFEQDVLPKLAAMGQLNSYFHQGFWQCMDTLREKNLLEDLYQSGNCPWKMQRK